MDKTNKIISIYRKAENWQHNGATTLVGSYHVWLEERLFVTSIGIGPPANIERARGFCILWEQLDLSDCTIVYDSKTYEILQTADFTFPDSEVFHHTEFIYG
jgi:hypothetical protein